MQDEYYYRFSRIFSSSFEEKSINRDYHSIEKNIIFEEFSRKSAESEFI